MAIEDDLLNDIKTSLGSAIIPSLTLRSDLSDLFEAYIFGLLIDEARNVGNVSYGGLPGGPIPTFTFRTSPGYISQTDPYSYAIISFNNKPTLEAHVGVYVSGRSGVRHECDVALMYQTEATTCRNNPNIILPRSSQVWLAVECKHYMSNLKLSLARQFIGLVSDITVNDAYFVTNSTSLSVGKLLTSKKKRLRWEPDTFPGSNDAVDRLRGLFKDSFKDYLQR
jgi:hypothetical protein